MSDRSNLEFGSAPAEIFAPVGNPWDLPATPYRDNVEARRQRKSFVIAIFLFLMTLVSTLAVGAQYASSYASGQSPDFDAL
ncbi:MAG TPA: hypothetical protein VFE02_11340, partial [Candidatus Acidoferrales bacterium]|nr:hypothetical protein [Candidatus Acidoferrales bacterium]